MYSSRASTDEYLPQEGEGQQIQIHKPKDLAMLTESVSTQILSLFFCRKAATLLGTDVALDADRRNSSQQGPGPPAPCPGPLHPQSHTASVTEQGRCIPNAAAGASVQTMREAQRRPCAQEATNLFCFTLLIICSTSPWKAP